MNNQKQFGVWMDRHHAIIVYQEDIPEAVPVILAYVKEARPSFGAPDWKTNHYERMAQGKFFKDISSYLLNATHIHVTGTGQAQEQFIHYLSDTPRFMGTKTEESTSGKMSDKKLLEFIARKFK